MHYPPPVNGGASFVGKMIKESVCINKAFSTDFINLTTSFNLAKVGKIKFGKYLTTIKIIGKVLLALNKNKYDLCYMTLTATGPGFYKDLLIVAMLKLFRQKILFHFHNKGISNASGNSFNNFFYRYTFKNVKCILISKRLYPDICKYVNPENVYYCPNGIPSYATLLHKDVVSKSSSGAICRLLFFSNMMVEKGVYVLLEACSILRDKHLNFECHFVGDWVDINKESFYKYISRNKLDKNVFAHGPKYDQDKLSYFEDADIFVFPTFFHNETFGLVNLEAMQHALPIVSTPEGGIPDVVVDGVTGFLVPQKDAQALANALEKLIVCPELRQSMGLAGNKRFYDLFTVDNFENNLKKILNKEVATGY
jgi:glycosyltransferase involved in cell wall biosynthesis